MTEAEGNGLWLHSGNLFGPMQPDRLDGYEVRYWSRLRAILIKALDEAPADDMLDRQRQIEATGFLPWTVWPGLEAYEYHLGGRLLARVPVDLFTDEAFMQDLPPFESVDVLPGEETVRGPAQG